jgi:HEAT repeats
MPTFFCWSCYQPLGELDPTGRNPTGRATTPDMVGDDVTDQRPGNQHLCPHCGRCPDPPEDADYTSRLVWALHHPLPDRRLLAAHTLGRRGDPTAVGPLRDLVTDPDPYVAAAALTSLAALTGLPAIADLIGDLAAHADAAAVRAAARDLLTRPDTTAGGATGGAAPRSAT